MVQPPPRGHPRPSPAVDAAAALGVVAILLSCGNDDPVELHTSAWEIPLEATAARGGAKLDVEDRALSVEDMLSDPLFQLLVQGIKEPSVAEPLLAAVEALAAGQTAKATKLLVDADAAADALNSDFTALEALVHWSALQRYFSAAELV